MQVNICNRPMDGSWVCFHLGVSVNSGTPISHPKMIIFSRKTPWLLGTTILRNTHFYPCGLGLGFQDSHVQATLSVQISGTKRWRLMPLRRRTAPFLAMPLGFSKVASGHCSYKWSYGVPITKVNLSLPNYHF